MKDENKEKDLMDNEPETTTSQDSTPRKTQNKQLEMEPTVEDKEGFLIRNQKTLIGVAAGAIIIIIAFFLLQHFYFSSKEKDAADQLFAAQQYFQEDAMDLALNGNGNHLGLIQIIDEYKGTQSGNLAYFYAGRIFLSQGEFQQAIDYLRKFKSKDLFLSGQAKALIGDAYWELNEVDEAISFYKKAVETQPNMMTTPFTLLKLGMAYETKQDYKKAADAFSRIKTEFPMSFEAREIEKYIARSEALK